jgi:hypothetical protein
MAKFPIVCTLTVGHTSKTKHRDPGIGFAWWGSEALHYASTLEDVPMLHGANLVYTFHHPVTPWAGMSESNSDSWRASFGYLAAKGLPVVDGEFNDDAKTYHLRNRRGAST